MPTDINLTPVLKFFTESMNHLVSTIELNQQSVQRTIQEQQQQFTSHLELLRVKIAQTASAAPPGQSSPSDPNDDGEDGVDNILPLPKKRRRTRHRCAVNTQTMEDVDMATYDQFLVRFRYFAVVH